MNKVAVVLLLGLLNCGQEEAPFMDWGSAKGEHDEVHDFRDPSIAPPDLRSFGARLTVGQTYKLTLLGSDEHRFQIPASGNHAYALTIEIDWIDSHRYLQPFYYVWGGDHEKRNQLKSMVALGGDPRRIPQCGKGDKPWGHKTLVDRRYLGFYPHDAMIHLALWREHATTEIEYAIHITELPENPPDLEYGWVIVGSNNNEKDLAKERTLDHQRKDILLPAAQTIPRPGDDITFVGPVALYDGKPFACCEIPPGVCRGYHYWEKAIGIVTDTTRLRITEECVEALPGTFRDSKTGNTDYFPVFCKGEPTTL